MSAAEASDAPLLIERDGAVCLLRLNRPAQKNAADAVLHRRLGEVWDEIGVDASIKAVVLTGAGAAFSAGGDFPRMVATQTDTAIQDEVFHEARRTVLGMVNLPQPIVAAVNGPAVGLGASLVALCDISVAADTAFFADPHLGVGLVPADGTAMLWPLLMGLARAKEFVFLGDRISAAQALDMGLVNRVVPAAETVSVAVEIAHKLAALPHRALQDTRRLMNAHASRAVVGVLDQAIAAERQSVASVEHIELVRQIMERAGQRREQSA